MWKNHNRVENGVHLPILPWFDGWRFGFVFFNRDEVFFGWYRKED